MISKQKCILRIVLSTPLRHYFDYLPPEEFRVEELQPGIRVRVPFGKHKERIGLLLKVTNHSDVVKSKLKRISKIIDQDPILSGQHLALLEWASTYYHHPIGEVFFNALPKFVRQGKSLYSYSDQCWQITLAGRGTDRGKFVNHRTSA